MNTCTTSIDTKIIKPARDNGQKGGHKRAEKYKPLMNKALELYVSKYSLRSNRDAARQIVKKLNSNDLEILTTDTPENTIERWIGKYKKEQL